MTEYAEMEGTQKDHRTLILALHSTAPRVTPWPGEHFQCLNSSLWVKNLGLISNINLPCHSFRPFPRVLSLVATDRRSVSALPLPFTRKLQIVMRCPLSLLFWLNSGQASILYICVFVTAKSQLLVS